MRQKHSPETKAKAVLDLLREEKPLSQISSELGVNKSLLSKWKTVAVSNMHELFRDGRPELTKIRNDYESQVEELYSEIGRLTTQLRWLKKKCSIATKQK